MLRMWLACARWREDGPWVDNVDVKHLRATIEVEHMGVDQLAELARALSKCPHCRRGIYVMLNDPRSDHVQQPQHDQQQNDPE